MEGLYTFKQFIAEQKLFTEGSLRNMIFKRHENGLEESGAIKRFGRKILIDKEKFFTWVNSLTSKDYYQKTDK
jgi:hypothetical protein